MSFLNPFFLISLIAVLIPVIIHLINLRKPQKLAYSTVLFFKELQKSTIRKLKLKRLLLLMLRTFAVVFIALALARPFLPPKFAGFASTGTPVLYGLIVDNGPSMGQIDGKGPYIEQAKEIAGMLISQARSSDRFLIYNTHGDLMFSERMPPSHALTAIDELDVQNRGEQVRSRFRELVSRLGESIDERTALYWITDARKTQIDALEGFEWPESNLRQRIPVLPVKVGQDPSPNVAITGISVPTQIMSYDRPFGVSVEVSNFGRVPSVNQFVSLEVEGRPAGQYEVDLGPGQTHTYYFEAVPGKTGDVRGRALLDGDPVIFDNSRYFSVRIPEGRRVLLVAEQQVDGSSSYVKPVLDAAEQTGGQLLTTRVTPAAMAEVNFDEYDAVILEGLVEIPDYLHGILQRYVQDGNGLIILPGERSSINSYNRFLSQLNAGRIAGMRGDYGTFNEIAKLDRLVEGHPVLDEIFDKRDDEQIDIDLPSLYYYLRLESAGGGRSQVLLRSTLNEPVMIETRYGNGKLLLFAMSADPGWSNLSVSPLYAPLFYRTALYAAASEQGGISKHILGSKLDLIVPFEHADIRISSDEENYRPETARTSQGMRIQYPALEWTPGWYTISDGSKERVIAVNQHISESDFSTFSTIELENVLKDFVNVQDVIVSGTLTEEELLSTIRSAGFGSEIWIWFIIAALICLIAESLISKKYSLEK
jgi:hypothetical protein